MRRSLRRCANIGTQNCGTHVEEPFAGDMASMGQPTFSEMPMEGIGFGLGGAILLDPAKAQILGSEGEFTWGGWRVPLSGLTPKKSCLLFL